MLKQITFLSLPRIEKSLLLGIMLAYSVIRQNPWQCILISVVIILSSLSSECLGKIYNLLRFKSVRIMLIIFCTSFCTFNATKAHAIFFSAIETYLNGKFSAVPAFSTTIGLGIPTLRILLIAFILWGFVKIAEAQNQGQDASGLFKTTVISLLVGFFGDEVLKQFIG